LETLRRRQEKEIAKIVERETTMAQLQQRIKRAEDEEIKKKKIHDRKVLEEKQAADKKATQRLQELKRQEQEEAEKKRELARRDAAIAEKLSKKKLAEERCAIVFVVVDKVLIYAIRIVVCQQGAPEASARAR